MILFLFYITYSVLQNVHAKLQLMTSNLQSVSLL